MQYSTVQLKLVVKTKFPFISPTYFTQIPLREFLWNSFPSFSPFFPDVGEIVCEFCFTIREAQFTNFPPISPEFPPNFPEIHRFSPQFPNASYWFLLNPQFPVQFSLHMCSLQCLWVLGIFLWILHLDYLWKCGLWEPVNSGEIPGNSGEFWGNSGEFWGNQTKSFSLVFTRFHSFSQVRNTFSSRGNLIPLISPVATVKTGENSGEKKWKGIHKKTWIRFSDSFHFPFPRPVSIAEYCIPYKIFNFSSTWCIAWCSGLKWYLHILLSIFFITKNRQQNKLVNMVNWNDLIKHNYWPYIYDLLVRWQHYIY